MKTLIIDHKNGHTSEYKLIEDGQNLPIAYHLATNDKLVAVLEHCRKNRIRIKINIGDIETGKSWNEEFDTSGYIGLSKGYQARFPILVNNSRSMGGGSLMDHCILQVKESKGGKVLYQAENFYHSNFEIKQEENQQNPAYQYSLYIDGKLYSKHKTIQSAEWLKKKLS